MKRPMPVVEPGRAGTSPRPRKLESRPNAATSQSETPSAVVDPISAVAVAGALASGIRVEAYLTGTWLWIRWRRLPVALAGSGRLVLLARRLWLRRGWRRRLRCRLQDERVSEVGRAGVHRVTVKLPMKVHV